MNKYKYFLLIIILLKVPTVVGQNKMDKTFVVNEFVNAVFLKKNTASFIADNYLCFQEVNNANYSLDDRIKILKKHLKKIKKEKSSLLDLTDFYVVRYNDYKNSKVIFSKMPEDVYVLVSKNSSVMYFYLTDDKIFSFDYIIKGDEGFFITY
jgi:uncharacterized protein (DUF342 family)